MRNKLFQLGLLSSLFGGMIPNRGNNLTPQDIDVTPAKPPIPNGCKEYEFNHNGKSFTCIAINKKNALRKFNAFKSIQQIQNQTV